MDRPVNPANFLGMVELGWDDKSSLKGQLPCGSKEMSRFQKRTPRRSLVLIAVLVSLGIVWNPTAPVFAQLTSGRFATSFEFGMASAGGLRVHPEKQDQQRKFGMQFGIGVYYLINEQLMIGGTGEIRMLPDWFTMFGGTNSWSCAGYGADIRYSFQRSGGWDTYVRGGLRRVRLKGIYRKGSLFDGSGTTYRITTEYAPELTLALGIQKLRHGDAGGYLEIGYSHLSTSRHDAETNVEVNFPNDKLNSDAISLKAGLIVLFGSWKKE